MAGCARYCSASSRRVSSSSVWKLAPLFLVNAVQSALRQVQGLRDRFTLGSPWGNRRHNTCRACAYPTFREPRQILTGNRHAAAPSPHWPLVAVLPCPLARNQRIGTCRVKHQRRVEGLFVGFDIGWLIAFDQHLARLQGAPGQPDT